MKSSFFNSFIRQMGRETAHSVYSDLTAPTEDNVNPVPYLYIPSFLNYLGLFIACLCLPFIGSFWGFIKGIKRYLRRDVLCYHLVSHDAYKYDGRYRGGKKYMGTYETKTYCWENTPELFGEDELKKYRTSAIVYIIISLLFVGFWGYVIHGIRISNIEEEKEIMALTTNWTSISNTDEFTNTTTNLEFILPTFNNVCSTDCVLIKENNKIYLGTNEHGAIKTEYVKNKKTGEYEYIGTITIKSNNELKDVQILEIKENNYREKINTKYYRPSFTTEFYLIKNDEIFNDFDIKLNNKIYKFKI